MTLLDRIDAACVPRGAMIRAAQGLPPDDAPVDDLLRSLLGHVRDLLNTRLGTAPAQMELGTPPPSELMRGDRPLIERMQRSIGEAIERYEPRLAAVRVTLDADGADAFMLRFRVRARVAATGADIAFRTFVDPAGRLAVRP
jgi:type VI secretion system protein